MELNYNINIDLDQRQELVMTPKLQMSIKLLQFSSLELEEYLSEELRDNPMLERDKENNRELEERLANQYQNRVGGSRGYFQGNNDYNYENFVSSQPNLIEYMENQLYQVLASDEMEIGRYLIGNLDEKGLLTIPLQKIAEDLQIKKKRVKQVLIKIQGLDPPGIAARSVKESLLLQLNRLPGKTQLAQKLVANYWEQLQADKFQEIADDAEFDREELLRAWKLVKNLNFHPATQFKEENQAQYITPDLLIKKIDDEYVIVMNSKASPVLRINSYYYNMMKNASEDKTGKFLKDKFKSAMWLIKSIEKRRITVQKIARSIVDKQKEFLKKGIKYLHPMTMEEVAADIDMHESTVSRATCDKYIQTPQGLFEMKFFFCQGIHNIASVSIKSMILECIDEEDPDHPLSDSKLSEYLLENEGLDISRRTVAKYRNQLGIPSSTKRKKR